MDKMQLIFSNGEFIDPKCFNKVLKIGQLEIKFNSQDINNFNDFVGDVVDKYIDYINYDTIYRLNYGDFSSDYEYYEKHKYFMENDYIQSDDGWFISPEAYEVYDI